MLTTIELPRNADAPARARRAVEQAVGATDAEQAAHLKLLVTELVTNSVVHGAGDAVRVIFDVDRRRGVRCEVIDGGSGFSPVARAPDRTESGGWGLMLVEQLADRWGVSEGSTHVWFEFASPGGQGGHAQP